MSHPSRARLPPHLPAAGAPPLQRQTGRTAEPRSCRPRVAPRQGCADDFSGSRSLEGRPGIVAPGRRRDADGLAQLARAKRCRAQQGRGQPAIGLGARAGQLAQTAYPSCARHSATAVKQGAAAWRLASRAPWASPRQLRRPAAYAGNETGCRFCVAAPDGLQAGRSGPVPGVPLCRGAARGIGQRLWFGVACARIVPQCNAKCRRKFRSRRSEIRQTLRDCVNLCEHGVRRCLGVPLPFLTMSRNRRLPR